MLSFFRASFLLLLVIVTAGSDGQEGWGMNYSPSYVCALKGSTVKMSCVLKYPSGYNLSSVFWTKPVTYGKLPQLCLVPVKRGRVQCVREHKDTYSITLTGVKEADKHIYYCRFTTNIESGKWTGVPGVQLDVTDLQVETQQSVKEGDSVTLRCKSSCSLPEETTFIWYKNTKKVNKGMATLNQLHLSSVNHSDAGNYRCAVRVKAGKTLLSSPDVYLKVGCVDGRLDWGVNYSPSYVCALKGSTVKISCTSTYYKIIQGFWTKPPLTGKETPDLCSDPDRRGGIHCYTEDKDTYSITLTNVTEADKHIYYCRFTDTQNIRWTAFPGAHLDVTDLQVETQQIVKEGDSVTLRCKSSCSLPEETTFIWYKNTQMLTERTENQLHLRSVSRSDAGNYRCAGRGKAGETLLSSPDVYLNVEYPPKSVSVSINGSAEIVSGDSVTLICSSDSNPPAQISFYKGKKQLESTHGFYRIANITSEASGNYSCSARNKHGSLQSESVTLNVMYPPKSVSVSINGSAEIVSGDSVTLICSSDSNPPALNFSWFKENQSLAVGSGQSFSISNFNSIHSGRYYCEAHNPHGSQRSASVSVTVKGVQRAALLTLTGIGAGCGGLIFIISIIVFFKKKKRDGGAEDSRQNQQNPIGRSAETASTDDSAVYSLVSANQNEDLYAKVTAKKPKRPRRDYGEVEEVHYASVQHYKNKDKTEEHQKMEMPRLFDANRFEDVIYSSVK